MNKSDVTLGVANQPILVLYVPRRMVTMSELDCDIQKEPGVRLRGRRLLLITCVECLYILGPRRPRTFVDRMQLVGMVKLLICQLEASDVVLYRDFQQCPIHLTCHGYHLTVM